MFWHVYRYKVKSIFRRKELVFWTLIFPLVLSTLFSLAFGNINSTEAFHRIDVALVTDRGAASVTFESVLASVSAPGDDSALLSVQRVTEEEAKALLEAGEIAAYVLPGQPMELVVAERGISQTIVRSFMDSYQQMERTARHVAAAAPQSVLSLARSLSHRASYLVDAPVNETIKDPFVTYYYALIAMACLYGGFLSMNEVNRIQANQTSEGARINVTPLPKMRIFFASVAAALTVQFVELCVLLAYLVFALGASFGNQIPLIALTCAMGTLTGCAFGAMIASTLKAGEGVKVGVLIGASMVMSFLAGMMQHEVRYAVGLAVPFLPWINPASLIADSFYALYYYQDYGVYIRATLMLLLMFGVFSAITYLKVRRKNYASL